jgi:hypothetical protein
MEAGIRKSGRKILVVNGHDADVAFDVPDRRQLFGACECGGNSDGVKILGSCRYQRCDAVFRRLTWT